FVFPESKSMSGGLGGTTAIAGQEPPKLLGFLGGYRQLGGIEDFARLAIKRAGAKGSTRRAPYLDSAPCQVVTFLLQRAPRTSPSRQENPAGERARGGRGSIPDVLAGSSRPERIFAGVEIHVHNESRRGLKTRVRIVRNVHNGQVDDRATLRLGL